MTMKDCHPEELLEILGDFTSKENWDKFFNIRGINDSFEWYAEWAQLCDPLLSRLNSLCLHMSPDELSDASKPMSPDSLHILVPGCGNSQLSEHLYDIGFHHTINIDFSSVVISNMLRRNVRERPNMRWRIMDMTDMQFCDESFDAVLDKGGLDALMEPVLGPCLGNKYLSEVKRVLKFGGMFICLTLAELHVLDTFFPKFRFGCKTSLYSIPDDPSKQSLYQTFMLVVEKDYSNVPHKIFMSINHSSNYNDRQVVGIHKAVERENIVREQYSGSSDVVYSLEDLLSGAKGNLTEVSQGRRVQFIIDGKNSFSYSCKSILLDALEEFGPFSYHCAVFFVPKNRAHEWLFSSEEGQWTVVKSSNATRLVMVILDACQNDGHMDKIQKDLSPIIKQLAPSKYDNGVPIPFMMASDGIKQRNVVHEVASSLTGPILVEDVMYENVDADIIHLVGSGNLVFRRLTFKRLECLVQSEALLRRKGSSLKHWTETNRKRDAHSKNKLRKKQGVNYSLPSPAHDMSGNWEVDHDYLASSYHTGIIAGFMLISSYLDNLVLDQRMVKTIVIGAGAGLLPMFLQKCMQFLSIKVVELDPVVVNVARKYFGFREDERLKVHIADGVQFVNEIAMSLKTNVSVFSHESNRIDVIIIDVDSSDSSSGMTCPAAEFVDPSFLSSIKDVLAPQGLFIANLVARSSTIKGEVVSRIEEVFGNLFCLELEEDVNEVIFAVSSVDCIGEPEFEEAANRLRSLLKVERSAMSESIVSAAKKIRNLR